MSPDPIDPDLAKRIARCLQRAPLFGDLDLQARASVAGKLTHLLVRGGSTLFRAGDPGDALYIVLSGRLAVLGPGIPQRLLIAELGADDIVGEMSLIGQRKRANDILALRDSEVLRLNRAEFERLTRAHPESLDGLMHTLVERASTPLRLHPQRPRTIAVLPRIADATNAILAVEQFVTALNQALLSSGARVRIASPAALDRGAAWLSQIETRSDYVLYGSDTSNGSWTELCLRQADLVVEVALLADAPIASALPPPPAGLLSLARKRELVLLREGDAMPRPGSTRGWLDVSPDTPHHHVALGSAADFRRLARLFTVRGVGVVMAGGGARGFAHIGVIRALREASVPIDLVGGTSMGAIIAAGVAARWTDQELHDRFKQAFVQSNPLSDYTVPFVSLFAGRKVGARLRAAFGSLDIEDLPIPMFCVSANLTTSQAHVFRRGPLHRWLRATVAIPGVLPPMVEKGQVLVDGGIIDNFPVQAMRDAGRGPVIGVDIETGGALAAGADVMEPWSASEFLRRLIWRRNQTLPFPSIVRILLRSALVASGFRAHEQRKAVDLLLLPPMTGFDLLDWSSFDRAIEVGYELTRKSLESIRGTELAGRLFWSE